MKTEIKVGANNPELDPIQQQLGQKYAQVHKLYRQGLAIWDDVLAAHAEREKAWQEWYASLPTKIVEFDIEASRLALGYGTGRYQGD